MSGNKHGRRILTEMIGKGKDIDSSHSSQAPASHDCQSIGRIFMTFIKFVLAFPLYRRR